MCVRYVCVNVSMLRFTFNFCCCSMFQLPFVKTISHHFMHHWMFFANVHIRTITHTRALMFVRWFFLLSFSSWEKYRWCLLTFVLTNYKMEIMYTVQWKQITNEIHIFPDASTKAERDGEKRKTRRQRVVFSQSGKITTFVLNLCTAHTSWRHTHLHTTIEVHCSNDWMNAHCASTHLSVIDAFVWLISPIRN